MNGIVNLLGLLVGLFLIVAAILYLEFTDFKVDLRETPNIYIKPDPSFLEKIKNRFKKDN